jgi:hypothetical protein
MTSGSCNRLVLVDESAQDPVAYLNPSRRRITAQSTWKKSTASRLVAWVRRNCRQLVSVCCDGVGGMLWRFRIRRIVEGRPRGGRV